MTNLPRVPSVALLIAAVGSAALFAAVPQDSFHPLASQASLLPLQLAALVWALSRFRR